MGGTTAKLCAGRRRRAADRVQLRGRAPAALRRGLGPADPHLHHRADRDRRGRRQHRRGQRDRAAQGRPAQRGLRSRVRPPMACGGAEPRSRTPTSCSAISNPDYFAGGEVTRRPRRRPGRGRAAGRPGGSVRHGGRMGHPRHRQRDHGERGARARRRAGTRPAQLRAARHGRRGTGARVVRREEARHRPRDLPAIGGGRLGARPARGPGPRRPRGDGGPAPRRGQPSRLSRRHSGGSRTRRAASWRTRASSSTAPPCAASPMAASSARASTSCGLAGRAIRRRRGHAARAPGGLRGRLPREVALTPPHVPVEFINVRVSVRAPVAGNDVTVPGAARPRRRRRDQGEPPRVFPRGGGFVSTTVYDRYRLPVGETLAGPAVVEEDGSTLVVGPGAAAIVAPSGNLIISLPRAGPVMSTRLDADHARGAVDAHHLHRGRSGEGIVRTSFSILVQRGQRLRVRAHRRPRATRSPRTPGASRPSSRPCPRRSGTSSARWGRTAWRPATCSSPTTRGWAPGT